LKKSVQSFCDSGERQTQQGFSGFDFRVFLARVAKLSRRFPTGYPVRRESYPANRISPTEVIAAWRP
jgi:hypothetical protein